MIPLLSQCLVGFTIEFDNAFELRMPHKTTNGKGRQGPKGSPWLVSQAMWANVMQHVPDEGIAVSDLKRRARSERLLLGGLERWRYVTIDPTSTTRGSRKALPKEAIVRPTSAGKRAQTIWGSLGTEIEGRWSDRFGADRVDRLRQSASRFGLENGASFPHYLPVVFPTQNGKCEIPPASGVTGFRPSGLDISALMSMVLQAFTIDFEDGFPMSMAIGANTLRVLTKDGVRPRDLPSLTGVSKEANAMCVGTLERLGMAEEAPDPSGVKGKLVSLTTAGAEAKAQFAKRYETTLDLWKDRYGTEEVGDFVAALLDIVGEPGATRNSTFRSGLVPEAENWRASFKSPTTLPHYPMVLHRGGFPDGA